jgi:hypothetical protein
MNRYCRWISRHAEFTNNLYTHPPQEAGATIIREDVLVVMAGAEWVEWYQTHGLQVFDASPFAPIGPLL